MRWLYHLVMAEAPAAKFTCQSCGKGLINNPALIRHLAHCAGQRAALDGVRQELERQKEKTVELEAKINALLKMSGIVPPVIEAKAPAVPRIHQALRMAVWIHWNDTAGIAKCYCCAEQDVTHANFYCGHVVSRADGGETKFPNLRPICQACKGSIGTQDMRVFAEACGFESRLFTGEELARPR